MNEFITSFTLGFLSTGFLFIVSCLLVVGAKSMLNALLNYLLSKNKPPQKEQDKPKTPKPKKPKSPSVVRTLEIDPKGVDKIYFKKAE